MRRIMAYPDPDEKRAAPRVPDSIALQSRKKRPLRLTINGNKRGISTKCERVIQTLAPID
ncbi:hypothetical protein G3O06_04485 [Burkholderia sp. Ac-20345]|uniref:hypothetical protein n=1 Tax=Burkholderia sp. Ac-20345 TaxID=2703891 RepID=UPI00197BA983|nr:hypothetical protein [Burkholderia sp. Ac-20345]MBN3776826.1 hypothetical protein [Burkholderia sp. Ac-20345]